MLRDILLWIQAHPKTFLTTAQQHLALSAVALSAVMSVGGPLGLLLTRRPSAANLAIGIANVLRTIPSLALLVVMLPVCCTGFLPTVLALTCNGRLSLRINSNTDCR